MSNMLTLGWWGRWRIIAAALLALAFAGCSALRLAYNQADTLIYWWLDDYVDFTSAQAPAARDAIAQWLDWHRRTQLPDYSAQLDRVAAELQQDITPAQACRWFEQVRERVDLAAQQALPGFAALAVGFDARQLDSIAAQQAEVAAKDREDFTQGDATERLAASVQRTVKRFEQLYGRLDAPQREVLAQGVAASPFDPERWLTERERRQRELMAVLRRVAGQPPAEAAALLRTHWQETQRSPDPAYRRYAERLEPYNCEFVARLHNATAPAQRKVAQGRLQGWQADLRRLVQPG